MESFSDFLNMATTTITKKERNPGAEKEWCTWDEWEIVTLISIYGSNDIQTQLTLSKHNSRVFELIAERMKSYDIERTPQQCRNKIKKLKCEYRKVDTDPDYRKTFNYYDQMSPFMKNTRNLIELESLMMMDLANSYSAAAAAAAAAASSGAAPSGGGGAPNAIMPPPPSLKQIQYKQEPNSNLSDDGYVEVELEECSDSGAEEYTREHWRPPSKPELVLGGGGGTKRPLEIDEEYEDEEDEEDEDPNGETSLDSGSDSEQRVEQQSNGSVVKRLRIDDGHQEQEQQEQQQPVLETLMETFLESMRRERRSMRKELAKFEERRIRLENEAELKKIQMEHQHELKMATLLGQITTQIIDNLAKRE